MEGTRKCRGVEVKTADNDIMPPPEANPKGKGKGKKGKRQGKDERLAEERAYNKPSDQILRMILPLGQACPGRVGEATTCSAHLVFAWFARSRPSRNLQRFSWDQESLFPLSWHGP